MTTIPRSEAIARMARGEPVETREERGVEWNPTMWRDFELLHPEFRIPPEPRRAAREWWVNIYKTLPAEVFDSKVKASSLSRDGRQECIHVREVLPDEVPVRRMSQKELEEFCIKHCISMPEYPNARVCWSFARALGLLKKDKS